jgi:hypothetical protein
MTIIFGKLNSGGELDYPLDLRAAYPDVMFPDQIGEHNIDERMAVDGVVAIHIDPPPEGDFESILPTAPALVDGEWRRGWSTTPLSAESRVQRLRDQLKATATARRYDAETGGVELPGGVRVNTATEDQNRITTVIANADAAGITQVEFKAATGWVTLTIAELRGIASAIALHVQDCFASERAHHAALDALDTVAGLTDYGVAHGWLAAPETPQ